MVTRKIWDGAVRLFHWSQLVLLAGLWWSAEQELYGIHMTLAYVLAALLLSRLIWGLIGSDTARFAHFVKSPRQVWQWWRFGRHQKVAGHHPVSAYMIVLLLTLVLLQFISGLMTSDQVLTDGPLVALVSPELVALASSFHQLNLDILLVLTAVHVLAAVGHQLRGDRLVQAMITGRQQEQLLPPAAELKFRPFWHYLLLFVLFFTGFYVWQGEHVLALLAADLA